jgi:tetratricopeptide (TPR) repeat protein
MFDFKFLPYKAQRQTATLMSQSPTTLVQALGQKGTNQETSHKKPITRWSAFFMFSPHGYVMKKFFIVVFLTTQIFITYRADAQWLNDSVSEVHVRRGIDFVYNFDFDSARAHFKEVVRLQPKHPAGHFFLAMVEWWNILIDIDNESSDERFYRMLDKVISICDERLDENEDDVVALFFKGGSLGFQGRLRANREDWLKAANDGREALPIVQQAYKLEPYNYDVLLGIGIYNYYAAVIPEMYPVVKPLMIFFPSGDKEKGIAQLRQASMKAQYANIEAKYFLMNLLYNNEKLYAEALPLALELRNQYPNNTLFHRYAGRCYASLSMWQEMYDAWNDVLQSCQKGQRGYNSLAEREAQYFIGLYQMNQGSYSEALKHFYRCDELSRTLDRDRQSGFMVMANLKIGMIYDKQMKRQYALQQYDKVLRWKEYQDSHKQAEQYKKTPFGRF